MKIVADENITFAGEAFSKIGNVLLKPGRDISRNDLIDADVLVVRSVTIVDKFLLDGTNVKFVGTATIGTDHIDTEYLREEGIEFASAKGCNSWAVTEYVWTAISYIAEKNRWNLKNKSLGIAGYGNIGSKVAAIGRALGLNVLINDPPIQDAGYEEKFHRLDQIIDCDIITFHVPLIKGGRYNTHHLIGKEELDLIDPGSLVINTSRGSVVNNNELKEFLIREENVYTVLDVWEEEPRLDTELLKLVDIGTPHIAGYSFEGKVNGTRMIFESLSEFLGINLKWEPVFPEVNHNIINTELLSFTDLFRVNYDIQSDDFDLRKVFSLSPGEQPKYFDSLRKNYNPRRELCNYYADYNSLNPVLKDVFQYLRINPHELH